MNRVFLIALSRRLYAAQSVILVPVGIVMIIGVSGKLKSHSLMSKELHALTCFSSTGVHRPYTISCGVSAGTIQ